MTGVEEFSGFGWRPLAVAGINLDTVQRRPVRLIPALPSELDPAHAPPPAAGVDSARAWLVVLATFLSTSTAFFVTYSFTTFLGAMSAEFGTGSGSTSLLFSLTIFFLFVLGLPAGRASDRWGPRPVMLVGAAILVGGLLATSVVPRIEYGYVTYGLGIGLGVACCYVPVVSQVTGWFQRRRAAALGVAVSGIGAGTILGPPVSQALIDAYGWRTTYQILAGVAAVGFLAAAALIAPAPSMAGAPPVRLGALFRSPLFRAMYIAGFLMSLGLFVPFVFLKPYAETQGIDPARAAVLVSVLGIGSLLGRLVLASFAGLLGVLRLYQLCFVVLAGSFPIWYLGGPSMALLALFAFVLGTAYGGYVALSPAAAAELFGLAGLGAVLGAMYTAGGVGGLIGPPVAGRVFDLTESYTIPIFGAMAVSVLGVIVLRRAITLARTAPFSPDTP